MPKYKIIHTPVLHGAKGEKTATRHEIGDTVELAETEALALGNNVEAVKPADDGKGNNNAASTSKKGNGKAETEPAKDK